MTLPPDLDLINLLILRAIAARPSIRTSEIEDTVRISRAQVLRRLKQLQDQGLVIQKNGTQGQTYRYELSSSTTPEEIEQFNTERLSVNRDPVAREALSILLQGIQAISGQLAEMAGRIESILR